MTDRGATAPEPPPPGWYEDPQVPGDRRWWNGAEWTDSHRPGRSSPWAIHERRGRQARNISIVGACIWAVTVAIQALGASSYEFNMQPWWVLPFLAGTILSIVAIVFGSIGLNRPRSLGGRTPARIGLTIGIAVLVSQFALPIVVLPLTV